MGTARLDGQRRNASRQIVLTVALFPETVMVRWPFSR
jgi:hypothetical protein